MNETMRAMWSTRPYRLPSSQGSSAPWAGVCEGIGIRYQIDPLIVRILFVCSAFFGFGLLAYLLCWLVMPRYSVPLSPVEAIFSKAQDPRYAKDRETGWILIVVLAVLGLLVGSMTHTVVLTLLIGLLLWWMLHSKEPLPPQVTLDSAVPVPGFVDTLGEPEVFGRTQPPAWDPLGTAPFAWDLPEPPPAPTAQKPKRHRVWPWLVIAGVIMTPILVLSTIDSFVGTQFQDGMGQQHYTVSNPESLLDSYNMEVGELHLDLNELATLPEDRTVTASMTTGEILIDLPDNVPVALTCSTNFGEANCGDEVRNKDAQGGTLFLNVHNDVGSIKVQ